MAPWKVSPFRPQARVKNTHGASLTQRSLAVVSTRTALGRLAACSLGAVGWGPCWLET